MSSEDYLEVDKPIPGQNYVCLSFISPEKTLRNKERFFTHRFLQDFLKEKYQVEESKLQDYYQEFLLQHETELDQEFTKSMDFQTNVRGLKVRGVFDTQREANIRAQVLQRMDRSFHVFVGQVGYWLPWDPSVEQIENQEYLEPELNNLVKNYKENETKRDLYYSQQVRTRKEAAEEENAQRKKEQAEAVEKVEAAVEDKVEKKSNMTETEVLQTMEEDDHLRRKEEHNVSQKVETEVEKKEEKEVITI